MFNYKILYDVKFVLPFLGIWGSFASFILSTPPFTGLSTIWIVGLFICSVWATILIYKTLPRAFSTNEGINKYMFEWLSNNGQVIICTRDMSWGNADKIKPLLFEKARINELSIILPNNTLLTNELKASGAKIYTYAELDYVPVARFTIIHYGTDYSRIAVGRKLEDKNHYIEEYSYGNSPVLSVAKDFVEIVMRYNEKKVINIDKSAGLQ